MNLSRNIKITIISIVALFVFILNLKYVFLPNIGEYKKSNAVYSEKNASLNNLENLRNKEAEISKQEKNLKYAFLEMDKKLPRYFVPENFVNILIETANRINKDVSNDNKIKLQDINFTKPVEYKGININPPQKLSLEADQRIRTYIEANKSKKSETEEEDIKEATNENINEDINEATNENINEDLKEDINEGKKEDANQDKKDNLEEVKYQDIMPGEMQFENIPDDKVINVDITFKFSGQSQQVKQFFAEMENSDIIMSIKSLSIVMGKKKGSVLGEAIVTVYGYKNDKLPTYRLWIDLLEKGKTDIFSSENSTRYDINNSNIGDFRIIVNRANDDAPSVILRKAGAIGTDLYGDDKGTEKVEIYLSKKDGKYNYRYNTSSGAYPADAKKTVEFVPTVPDNIIVKVFSNPRISNDLSGMDLVIYNETGAKVQVKVYNDDESNPRVTHRTEEIPVKGDNNER